MPGYTESLIYVGVIAMVFAAAVSDWQSRLIPNLLTLGGAVIGIGLHTAMSGFSGLQLALSGWAVGFLVLLPGYLFNQTGAGDVKLMAAAGSFLGPLLGLYAALATVLTGAVFALCIATFAKGTSPWLRYRHMFSCLLSTGRAAYEPPRTDEVMGRSFPYGVAIATGCTIVAVPALINSISRLAGSA